MEKTFNGENKRKFYRINFETPLCGQMTIKSINGKDINSGYSHVCIKDVGPGGLSFISKLEFPINKQIIYRFKITIENKIKILEGTIVRFHPINNDFINYGIKFNLDNMQEDELIKILNKLTVLLKNDFRYNGCTFCKKSKHSCLNSVK